MFFLTKDGVKSWMVAHIFLHTTVTNAQFYLPESLSKKSPKESALKAGIESLNEGETQVMFDMFEVWFWANM